MAWLVKVLGIDRVRQAFARLAAVVDLFVQDFEEARLKMGGKVTPPGIGEKKTKADK